MRDFDLTPVRRSTIGFDRLFDLIDDSFRLQGEDNYPPYNIARVGEDHSRISLALAGFKPEEITVLRRRPYAGQENNLRIVLG